MSKDNKELKNEGRCEGITNLSMEDLEEINGGVRAAEAGDPIETSVR